MPFQADAAHCKGACSKSRAGVPAGANAGSPDDALTYNAGPAWPDVDRLGEVPVQQRIRLCRPPPRR